MSYKIFALNPGSTSTKIAMFEDDTPIFITKAVHTADELANLEGSINYEVVCGLSKRVPRVYLKGGKVESIYNALLGEDR